MYDHRQVKSMKYSVIVFDTAPTGHTLRFLSFPTVLEKALAKISGLSGRFGPMFQQVNVWFVWQANKWLNSYQTGFRHDGFECQSRRHVFKTGRNAFSDHWSEQPIQGSSKVFWRGSWWNTWLRCCIEHYDLYLCMHFRIFVIVRDRAHDSRVDCLPYRYSQHCGESVIVPQRW